MTNFPNDFDDDTTLPFVNDNITEIGGDAINALRDAVFEIEQNIGLGAQGTTSSIATRLSVAFNPDGSLKPSTITSLGLVTLPITEDQISNTAEIPESKLRLDHRTQDLFNYIRDLSGDINVAIGWMSVTGIKLEPHLIGAIYRHTMNQIDVSGDQNVYPFLDNKFRQLRDNLQSYNLVADINSELLAHQWADGSPFGVIQNVVTNNGSVYPSNYGHTASGIFLNTSRFTTIPQTALDLQLFAEFIDSASIFLLGTRIQNLYTNGISKASRSSSLVVDGYGQNIVPPTPAIAYLKNIGNSSSPFDSIDTGDDIIEFKPVAGQTVNHTFDSQFNLVRTGDIVRINYGSVEVSFIIKEKKYIQNGSSKKFIVRIAGKNLDYAPNASARIDKPLFNSNKYGVLSIAGVNNAFSEMPSLIVSSPRGAQALGIGFTPDEFDQTHYLLYLAIYPTGHPQDGYTILPGIDVTGNLGTTPGLYTLDSIVQATNTAFRKNGFNYRFIAFSYQGEFGIMLADPYGNASFSILSAVITPTGVLDEVGTSVTFPNNVVDMFPNVGGPPEPPDPLGFGPFGAGIASPAFQSAYASAEASQNPTKLFVPLLRNNFYVNGVEKERLTLEVGQALDGYGDGYWVGRVIDVQSLAGRVQTTYRVPLDLSASSLKAGKTLVVQSLGEGNLVDFGRFIIQSINFGCSPSIFTDITVYDAVHGKGFSPTTTIAVDGYVSLYFNSDSVSFNTETATDYTNVAPFKRHFEVYIDQNGQTFTHERGRMLVSGTSVDVNGSAGTTLFSSTEVAKLDIIKISPKLRGNQQGNVNLITLNIDSYDNTTGIYVGRLSNTSINQGPTVTGKKGEITRFYDGTFIDYIDFIFDVNVAISSFTNQKIDIQLFPTLSLDDEIMLVGTCQVNDTNKTVTRIRDERQFGNTSEKDLSTSALNYIALPERLLHFNGVVRGFDIADTDNEVVTLKGGVALVNGNIKQINYQTQSIPKVVESFSFTYYPINWALCVNSVGELISVPLTDFDSTLGTPNSPNRVISLFNSTSSTTYETECTTFANLINDRKDLTILYIASVSQSAPGSNTPGTVTYKDVRRFINDQDSATPVIVSSSTAQSNFKNIDTALNWMRFNTALQNNLAIKGSFSITSAFNFSGLNVYSQGAGSAVTFASTCTASAFRFRDLTVTLSSTGNISGSVIENCPLSVTGAFTATSVDFNKCATLSFNNSLTATGSNFTAGSMNVAGAASITNCTLTNIPSTFSSSLSATNSFIRNVDGTIAGGLVASATNVEDSALTITGATTITNGYFRGNTLTTSTSFTATSAFFENAIIAAGTTANVVQCRFKGGQLAVTGTSTINSCHFEDCVVVLTGAATISFSSFRNCTLVFTNGGTFTSVLINPSNVTIGATITGSGITIIDSDVVVSAVRGFTLGDNFRLERNRFIWTGAPVSGFSATDLVNSGNGMAYYSSGSSMITNVLVRDNVFSTSLTSRFPFFSFQLTDYPGTLRDVIISGNKFTSDANADDFRAVIAVVSTLLTRSSPGVFPQFPSLINCHFDNNHCNYNQMIIITGTKDYTLGGMNGANPITLNSSISGNTCGTIAYFTGATGPYDGINVGSPNFGVTRDKANRLIISQNTCKLITNLDHVGDYVCFRATRFPSNNFYEEVASTIGEVAILHNTCHWIQVGAGGYTIAQSGVEIIGNSLSPANPSFLSNYTSFGFQSVTPANVGILIRREHNAIGNSQNVISQNVITQKYTSNSAVGLNITAATNASPIAITTSTAHGFLTGQLVNVSGVTGNTAANGTWFITVTGPTTFTLTGSAGNGAYTSGGIVTAANVYYYDAGIACFNHCIITNNTIASVVNSTTAPLIYFWDINSQIVTGNVLIRGGLSCNAYFFLDGLSGDGTAAQKLVISHNTMDAVDPGAGFVNRYYIKQNPSGTAAYGTGSSLTGHQSGWRANSNIAGTQGSGFVYI
jgi:hypothetical protein